ncbi:hypothetical protein D9M68_847100 [compost metagenome]
MRQSLGFLPALARRREDVHQPDTMGLLRVDALTCVEQARCLLWPKQSGQRERKAEAGMHPDTIEVG